MGVLSDKLYNEGLEAMRRKDFEEAEGKFKQALAYKHDHSKTVLQYGILLQNHRKDYAAAVLLWRRAAEGMLKNKYHVQMLCNLSIVLTKVLQDYNAAERYYRLALEADATHVNSLVNYGLFLATVRKDFDKAEVMLRRAIRADPGRTKINNGGYLLQELIQRNTSLQDALGESERMSTGASQSGSTPEAGRALGAARTGGTVRTSSSR
mmetsp:Transcript_28527/g.70614  ORF Transcript_28527/g.70614 Transcript_28527/m.70614 type:complete len:209 (+) Transcript_28527:123-749(+)